MSTMTREPTKRDLKRYAKQHTPRYRLRVNGERRMYVWDEWIAFPRPFAALLAPRVTIHPLRGTRATVIVNDNKPTRRVNGAAHKGVFIEFTGPGWTYLMPIGEGGFTETRARRVVAEVNQLARRLD